MREETVPIGHRLLIVGSKLSQQQIDHLDKVMVPATVDRCRARLDSNDLRAVQEYLARTAVPNRVHLVVFHAYADLPLGKEFGVIFRLEGKRDPQFARAILRHAVCRGLPFSEVGEGHHQVCVFEFPDGLPSLIESLEVEKEDGLGTPQLGLCATESWQAICEHRSSLSG